MSTSPRRFVVRLTACVLAVAAPLLTACSGDGLSSDTPAEVQAAVRQARTLDPATAQRRIVLVGLEGVDPDMLDNLIRRGLLPNMARLRREGASGAMRGPTPRLLETGWTTVATGAPPEVHGVFGDSLAEWPGDENAPPLPVTWRASEMVWETLGRCGVDCTVIDWPLVDPSVAPENVRLIELGAQTPPDLAAEVRQPGDLSDHDIRPFVEVAPADLSAARRSGEGKLPGLLEAIARAETARNVASRVMREQRPRLLAARFRLIEDVCRDYMRTAAPRLPGVDEAEFLRERAAVSEAYRWQDQAIGELMEQCDENTLMIVVSPYGYRHARLRGRRVAMYDAEGITDRHRDHGVFLAWGDGVPQGVRIHGASAEQVAPTVLSFLGFPIPTQEMTAERIEQAFAVPREPRTVDGYFGAARRAAARSAYSPDGGDARPTIQLVRLGERYLARAVADRDHEAAREALDAFIDALERRRDDPRMARTHLLAARTYLELAGTGAGETALVEADRHLAAALEKLTEAPDPPVAADAALLEGRLALARTDVTTAEDRIRAAVEMAPHRVEPHLTLAALVEFKRSQLPAKQKSQSRLMRNSAIAALEAALRVEPRSAFARRELARLQLGAAGADVSKIQTALQNLEMSLDLEPRNYDALNNSSVALLRVGILQGRIGRKAESVESFERALGASQHAISVDPGRARAFCSMAYALWHLDDLDGAVQAANQVLALDPAYRFQPAFVATVIANNRVLQLPGGRTLPPSGAAPPSERVHRDESQLPGVDDGEDEEPEDEEPGEGEK